MGYYDIRDCFTVTVGGSLFGLIGLYLTLTIRKYCNNKALKFCGFLIAALWAILLFAGLLTTWYLAHKQLYWPALENAWALGMVDHNSAKIWVHSLGDKQVRVLYESEGTTAVSADYQLSSANNWSTTIILHDLQPDADYSYQIVSGTPLSATFTGTFRTFPPPFTPQRFKFNFGSCLMPVPWTNMHIFDFWGKQDLSLAMLIGDAVYLDTFGIIPPAQAYPQVLADPIYSKFFQNTPNYFMYDDHEIINDYDQGLTELYNETVGYWKHYYADKNPVLKRDALYYNVTYGDVGFFVMDVRMYRSPSSQVDNHLKTMLGAEQKEALKQWLLSPGLTFKFLVSPVPYTVRLDLTDGWQGYITEREEIFDFIEENHISGCVLLSADSHFSGVYQFRDWLWEYSASPLYAIPLVQNVYFHPEDHPVVHPVQGHVISDHQVWWNDISQGVGFSYGTVEVNTKGPTAWYRVSIMGFNAFGYFGASPGAQFKRYLHETTPNRKPEA